MNNLFSFANTINSYIVIALLLIVMFLFYMAIQKTLQKKLNFSNAISKEFEDKEEQFRIYFLFFGITIPLVETLVTIFEIRTNSFMIVNYTVGIVLLVLYFITGKSSLLYQKIYPLFISIYLAYFCFTVYTVFFSLFELISYITLIVAFFLSYFIFKNIKHYWFFTGSVLLFLLIAYQTHLIEDKLNVLLTCTFISVMAIHISRHLSQIETKNKFLFSSIVVNNGNSLIMTTNKKGEVSFCSESVEAILGYKVDEVLGMGFWQLTEDSEFIGEAYHNTFVDDRSYVRKLKCKNGDYKYIQWKDEEEKKRQQGGFIAESLLPPRRPSTRVLKRNKKQGGGFIAASLLGREEEKAKIAKRKYKEIS